MLTLILTGGGEGEGGGLTTTGRGGGGGGVLTFGTGQNSVSTEQTIFFFFSGAFFGIKKTPKTNCFKSYDNHGNYIRW